MPFLEKYRFSEVDLNTSSRYDSTIELVYHDLIHGKKAFSVLRPEDRRAMADEVFELFTELNPVMFATVIDKVNLKHRYGENAYDPKNLAIRSTIARFSLFLEHKNGIGNIMMDKEEVRNDRSIQEIIRIAKIVGIELRGSSYQPIKHDKLERISNTISFLDSAAITGIQLADVCCRTVWQTYEYEHRKASRYYQLEPYWNEDENRVYDPTIFPKERTEG